MYALFVSGLRLDAALPVNVIVSLAALPNVVLPSIDALPVTVKSPPILASSPTDKSSVVVSCSA